MENVMNSFMGRIQVYGFHDVANTADLITLTSEQARVVIIDLGLVCSAFHLKAAIGKALLNEANHCMKTKSISAEVLYQLSPTTKINESIKQYGASATSSTIAVVIIDQDLVGQDILARVSGQSFDIELLGSGDYCSAEKAEVITKFFRLSQLELQVSTLEAAVVTHVAVKDCL